MSAMVSGQRFCELSFRDTKVGISYVIGQVVSAQTNYTTHVSGGGSYTGADGYVHSRPVSSHDVKRTQFFLRTAQGRDVEINMRNIDLGVIPGHELTLLIGETALGRSFVGALNHNTLEVETWGGNVDGLLPTAYASALKFFASLAFILGMPPLTCGHLVKEAASLHTFGVLMVVIGVVFALLRMGWRSSVTALHASIGGVLLELRSRHTAAQNQPATFSRAAM